MNNDDEIIFKNAISNFKEKKYLSASENFEYLLAKYPKNINLLKNLSLSYFHDKKFFKAETSLKNILKINNKDKDIVEFLIACLKKQDKAQEVIEVIKIYSDIINPKYNLMSKFERAQIPESVEDIEFIRKNTLEKISISCSDEKNNLKIDENFLDPPIFTFSYDNENNLDLTKKFHKLFINYYPELSQKICLKKKIRLDKIKIGFVSEYFSSHTISKLFKGVIFMLNEDIFDIKVFYLGHKKPIDQEFLDKEITKKNLTTIALPKNFKSKTEVILKENLDIIFYPDIGMSAEMYYLSFLRLAPKQITCWGHPETTGNPNIDYFLSSKLLETKDFNPQKNYSEKLLLSDYLPMYFYKPKIHKIDDEEITKNNIYSCPQSLFKIHPDFDDIIIKILKNDLKGKIFLIHDNDKVLSKKIYLRIKKKDSQHLDRLIFLDRMNLENYIHHCGRSTILLDPFYFGAGNSFHESMFYGTQTVSMPTHFLKSRIVLGAYKQMKITDPPIANSVEDYVDIAIFLANMPPKSILERKKFYQKCADKNLFENEKAIRSIENILINISK